jgi:hypothetical protein
METFLIDKKVMICLNSTSQPPPPKKSSYIPDCSSIIKNQKKRQGNCGNKRSQRSFNENHSKIALFWVTNEVFRKGAKNGRKSDS